MIKGSREAWKKKNKISLEFHSQSCSWPSWEAYPLNNTDKMLTTISVDTLLLIAHSKARHLLEMPTQPCNHHLGWNRYTSKAFISSITLSLSKKNPTTLKKASNIRSFEKVTGMISRLQPNVLNACWGRESWTATDWGWMESEDGNGLISYWSPRWQNGRNYETNMVIINSLQKIFKNVSKRRKLEGIKVQCNF